MIRLHKSTRYALYATMEMASAATDEPVTALQVAERHGIPVSVVAKVFQQLVRVEIAVGARGAGGGYRLARKPTEVTLLDVVEAIEPGRAPGECLLADGESEDPCVRHLECRLRELFDEVDGFARSTFASITLETLVGHPRPGMGLKVAEVRS